jgi:hypothetical protein
MARLLWQQRQDIGPPARIGAAMVYMASTARSILWGGGGLNVFGDTWEWDGEGWVQVEDTGPAPSALVGLAFDSDRNVAVLFTQTDTAWETWEWDCSTWTQVEDSGPQAAQGAFQMVYDRARQLTVLEGGGAEWPGSTRSRRHLGLGCSTWTQVADVGPPQRAYSALGYDASRERIVHFGGINFFDETYARDTWEWDGNAWEQVTKHGPSRSGGSCHDRDERGDASLRRDSTGSSEHSPRAFPRHLDVGWRALASTAGHRPQPALLAGTELGRREEPWSAFRRRHVSR